jgi:hypothetical protein
LINTEVCGHPPVNQQVFIETEHTALYANIRGKDENALNKINRILDNDVNILIMTIAYS